MASLVGKAAAPVAKKVFHDKAQQRFANFAAAEYDPKYEYKEINGKMKKVKKEVADYVPEHDARILKHVRKWAHRMDTCLTINLGCIKGTYGWAFWIGLFPEVGDVINIIIALTLLRKCNKIKGGLPFWDNLAIFAFIFSDFLVGLVPLIGDLGDAYLKANRFMAQRLEKHLDKIHDPQSAYNIKRRNKVVKAGTKLSTYDPEKAMGFVAPSLPAVPPPAYSQQNLDPRLHQKTTVPLRFTKPLPVPTTAAHTHTSQPGADPDRARANFHGYSEQPAVPRQNPSRFGKYAGEALEIAKPYAKPAMKSAYNYAKTRHAEKQGKPPPKPTKLEFI